MESIAEVISRRGDPSLLSEQDASCSKVTFTPLEIERKLREIGRMSIEDERTLRVGDPLLFEDELTLFERERTLFT